MFLILAPNEYVLIKCQCHSLKPFVSWSRIFQPWCIWVLHGETNGCFFNLFAKCLLGNKKLSVIFVSLVFYFDIYVPFMNFVSFLQIGSLLFLSALGVFPVSCVFFMEFFCFVDVIYYCLYISLLLAFVQIILFKMFFLLNFSFSL